MDYFISAHLSLLCAYFLLYVVPVGTQQTPAKLLLGEIKISKPLMCYPIDSTPIRMFLKNLRHRVFWPPFLFLVFGTVYSQFDAEGFLTVLKAINSWILVYFGPLFCYTALVMLAVVLWAFFSPLGKVRIGGDDAEPLLTKWRWFSITLCTTIAIGILFWGTAEPMYHLVSPPSFAGVEPNTQDAALFALETMYLHWAFTPYAIYTVPSLVFALAFYNYSASFSLRAMVEPIFPKSLSESHRKRFGTVVDAICLYSLVAGMAAALGSGILTLSGGLDTLFGIPKSTLSLFLISAAICITFTLSSISGLMSGIRLLSDWNAKIFFAMALFVLVAGPTAYIFSTSGEALLTYITDVIPRTAAMGISGADKNWVDSWTIFYWAVWMAWAPVTALFLGRISRGYTVREFIVINFCLPAIFSIVWMSIFSGAALELQLNGAMIHEAMTAKGTEHAVYTVFDNLPGSTIMAYLFFFVSFLSFVTASDSNSSAMGGICTKGLSSEEPEADVRIKVLWGIVVGTIAWVMVSTSGIEGVKMSSNLGGFPAMFLLVFVTLSLIKLILRSYKKPKSSGSSV